MAKLELGIVGATISPKVKEEETRMVGGEERTISTKLIQPTSSFGLQGDWRMLGKKEGLELDLFAVTTYGKGSDHSLFSASAGMDLQRNFLNIEEETGAALGLKIGYMGLWSNSTIEKENKTDWSNNLLLMIHADIHPNGWAKKFKVAIESGIAFPLTDQFLEDRFILTQISVSMIFGGSEE